jgi:hypothetical protein
VDDEALLAGVRGRVRAGRPLDRAGAEPLPPPASGRQVAEAEEVIGHRLPGLLRSLYVGIANGGMGPGFGIEGLPGGYASESYGMLPCYLDRLTADLPPGAPPAPPPGVLFIANWGCAIWSLLDCREPAGRIWSWEEGDRWPIDLTFGQWLEAWLDGEELFPIRIRELEIESAESWWGEGGLIG